MKRSAKATNLLAQIHGKTQLGELRKIAKEIKRNHSLAMELWSSGQFLGRQLSILIMDHKLLSQDLIDQLDKDMLAHPPNERTQLADWLMANQLSKNKQTISLMESWENSPSALQRRLFWYYQARLRWMGQTPPDNTDHLLDAIEKNIAGEEPEVQWAMNFTAAWIGVYNKKLRKRCVSIGETTGLYKGEMVSKGCTPNYLPDFIAIEAAKRNL